MELETDELAAGTARVVCRGRFNMAAAPEFRRHLDEVVAAGSSRVVVDLGEVTFVDSSGLGALVAGLKRARQAGGGRALRVFRVSICAGRGRHLRALRSRCVRTRAWHWCVPAGSASTGWPNPRTACSTRRPGA